MPDAEMDQATGRRHVSAWAVGGLALGWLVVLGMLVDDTVAVLQLWATTVVAVMLVVRARRRSSSAGQHVVATGADAEPVAVPKPPQTVDRLQTIDPPQTTEPPTVEASPMPRTPASWPLVMTAEEAAAFLRIDLVDILDAIRDGQLPGNHLGSHWRIRTNSLLTWIEGTYSPPRRPRPKRM